MSQKKLVEEMVKYRARHNLSQKRFAEMAKLSSQTVNAIENGTQTPTKLTEAKIKLIIEGE